MSIWETCEVVERDPERVSGAWVFRGTRLPITALFGNLALGASVEDFVEWFQGVDEPQVKALLAHVTEQIDAENREYIARIGVQKETVSS